jgi:hypothetical protein
MLTPAARCDPGGRLAVRAAAPGPRPSAPAGELTDDKLAVYVRGQVGQVAEEPDHV